MSTPGHDAIVRKSFEAQVDLFVGEDTPFTARPASVVAWLGPLEPSMIVLDVACGAAHVAEQIAPHVHQVVGLDLTSALLQLAADRLSHAGITNVLLQEGNAADLPFLDASFDLVVCRSSLHHFPAPERPVAEMARVCRPGGRVAVSDMVAPNIAVRQAFDDLHRRVDPSHAAVLVDAELADLLRSAVGPLSHHDTVGPFRIPIDEILTDASDRHAVETALRAELDGGQPTGFYPVVETGRVLVSFTSTVVQAARQTT